MLRHAIRATIPSLQKSAKSVDDVSGDILSKNTPGLWWNSQSEKKSPIQYWQGRCTSIVDRITEFILLCYIHASAGQDK